jgi:hypothetical protein
MTTATRTVQKQSFQLIECDIPPELTISQYRSQRRARPRDDRRRQARSRLASLIRR